MKEIGFKTKALNLVREVIRKEVDEERLYRLVAGKKVTDLAAKMVPNHYQYPKNSKRTVTRGNFRYELDLSDLMDWHAFYGFREESTDLLVSLCKPGNVIFDVGSNIGVILLRMGTQVGPMGEVFGFEPHPDLFQKCAHNLNLNKTTNITLSRIALGEKTKSACMKVCDPHNQGKNRILGSMSDATGPTINIMTMDEFVLDHGVSHIDLIKIDVEGYEYKVLMGAQETLKASSPDLFIEVDESNLGEQGHTAKDLLEFLEGLGYSAIEVISKRPVTSSTDFTGCHIDIFATRKGS
jgi:FkbM family methyltransferase